MEKAPKTKKSQTPAPNPYKDYARYTGLAFQMAGLIFLGYWLGKQLDQYFELKIPAFTISLILLFIFAALYSLIKSLPKE
ncbi:MAG: AtpZ/AtpI family protein [Cyclobacteriaceae bacterium]|nr:AtpZ/AtpI family protein [Cyclobacteriaceae bacterium]